MRVNLTDSVPQVSSAKGMSCAMSFFGLVSIRLELSKGDAKFKQCHIIENQVGFIVLTTALLLVAHGEYRGRHWFKLTRSHGPKKEHLCCWCLVVLN